MNSDTYAIGAVITGLIAFIGLWIYSISSWGLLIGLAIGWLPAIIGAVVIGLLWPLIVGLIVVLGLGLLFRII